MILVTAAYGNQGRLLIPKLLTANLPVRACVQSGESARRLQALGVDEVTALGALDDQRRFAAPLRHRGEWVPGVVAVPLPYFLKRRAHLTQPTVTASPTRTPNLTAAFP